MDHEATREDDPLISKSNSQPKINEHLVDKEHAATLLETPDLACGYSRDGFIDIESMNAGDAKV